LTAIARIVHVAEVYDTLTAPGTYRYLRDESEAFAEPWRVAGTQTDPSRVAVLGFALYRDAARQTTGTGRVLSGNLDFEQQVEFARQAARGGRDNEL
jgi:HD-GYP domain-containing protein (c-di-GMP phosphodiesterase class II)